LNIQTWNFQVFFI